MYEFHKRSFGERHNYLAAAQEIGHAVGYGFSSPLAGSAYSLNNGEYPLKKSCRCGNY
ncbi:MAG: hypothetical protein HY514_05340 [Candidatus Aenigmarchaeota archaeon]|nr:hypothetical protein [Candidatus Aenigmarchaeota archaeon]